MDNPDFKVSVVIPLYNKKDFILSTINSVLNQTLLPAEIIIVNDGSTDGSELVVQSINHSLIKIIHQTNSGVSAARNAGINTSKFEWISFLDADDIWHADFLKEMATLSLRYAECSMLASKYVLRDFVGRERPIKLNKMPFLTNYGILSNYFQVASHSDPPICSSSITIKKKSLVEIQGFPVGIKSGEDLLTWAKLACLNQIGFTNKELSVFVQNEAHTYFNKPNRIPEKEDFIGLELLKLANNNESSRQLLDYCSFWKKTRASAFLRLGMRREALKECLLALEYNRKNKMIYVYLFLLFLPNAWVLDIFKHLGKSK